MQQVPLSARAASMAPGGYARGRRAATATPDHSHCRAARKADLNHITYEAYKIRRLNIPLQWPVGTGRRGRYLWSCP